MTDVLAKPKINDFETEISSTITATDVSFDLEDAPGFTLTGGEYVYAVADPLSSSGREVMKITAVSGNTVTVTRNLPDYEGGAGTASAHSGGTKFVITDSWQLLDEMVDGINGRLETDGTGIEDGFNILTASGVGLRDDAGELKLKDSAQAEVSLSTLAAAAGVDDKAKVSAADTTSGYLGVKINAGDGLDEAIGTPGGDETVDLSVDVTDIIDTNYGLTEDTNNIRVNLDATAGLEFNAGALRAKVKALGGITRDADGLSLTEAFSQTATGIAYESIAQGDAICERPIEVEKFAQLGEGGVNLGDSNTRRRYAVKITPSKVPSFTTMKIRGKEAAASTMTLTVTIETDNAGEPSGTPVTNGTANTIATSSWTGTYADRTVTWGTAPVMAANTDYWLVLEVDKTDAVNYITFATNSAHDEDFLTFTRLTYNLDTATWGSSSTTDTPYFWTVSTAKALGTALVPTDANFGGRTWDFVGIAAAAYSAKDTVAYYYEQVPVDDLGLSLVAGQDYYISPTAGELTTTIPNGKFGQDFRYKIGRTNLNGDGDVVLKIEPGEKRVWNGYVTLSSTTAEQVILWFKPSITYITAGTDGPDSGFSTGFYDGTNNNGLLNGNTGAIFRSDTNCIDVTDSAGGQWTAAGSATTDIGFTLTHTEAAGAKTYVYQWESKQ